MNRREFLAAGAATIAMPMNTKAAAFPIIDTHIHLFDPRRPEGIPWPEKNDTVLYKPALPDRYRNVIKGLGVVGAIEVEASPWLEDNQWVLDVIAKDPIMVGTIGDIDPGTPDFRKNLGRFHRNKLFLGIRCGNLWARNFGKQVTRPPFIADLKVLAAAGLTLDTANQDAEVIAATLHVSDRVPNLRIVIDHLPNMDPPSDARVRKEVEVNLQELGKRPNVYVKVSEVLRQVDGKVPHDLKFYRPRLDRIWDIFGEDRVVFGSDWPNSDTVGTYPRVLSVVREYFSSKGRAAEEKYFWKNSIAAYRWVKRDPSQPQLA